MQQYQGEIAAIVAVLIWTFSSQTIEISSRRVGAQVVNFMRLIVAVLFGMVYLYFVHGEWVPMNFTWEAWGWLALSGFIGLFLGDMCLFAAFLEIGPRLSLLIMSLNAPLAALIAWMFMGEDLSLQQWAGMFVTLFGVGWVIMERAPAKDKLGHRKFVKVTLKGVLLAMGGMLGQALGAVSSKHGMGNNDPFQATEIRMLAAVAVFAIFFTGMKWWPKVVSATKDKISMICILFSGIFGTAMGIGMSMVAFQKTSMGTATTIISLVPVFLVPVAIFVHKEHVSPRAIFGTLLAFTGIYLMVQQ